MAPAQAIGAGNAAGKRQEGNSVIHAAGLPVVHDGMDVIINDFNEVSLIALNLGHRTGTGHRKVQGQHQRHRQPPPNPMGQH